MGLNPFSWFNSNSNDEREEQKEKKPPKPECETKEITDTISLKEVTLQYQNGDTETVEAFGVERGFSGISIETTTKLKHVHHSNRPYVDYQTRQISSEVLARDPVVEEVGTATITLSYEQTYDWEQPRFSMHSTSKEWVEGYDPETVCIEVDKEYDSE